MIRRLLPLIATLMLWTGCGPDCSCDGRQCGTPSGCEESCGQCVATHDCVSGLCVCEPQCTGLQCGGDGCGGVCGTCADGEICKSGSCFPTDVFCEDGTCICHPDCALKTCGSDGCGGSCGTCPGGFECDEGTGACECKPDCSGLQCGDDGCWGSCGVCSGAGTCVEGVCCEPSCLGDCGSDGCGGLCGTCPVGYGCQAGQCSCEPSCAGKDCGDDGCLGSCGTCEVGFDCQAGMCSCTADCEGKTCGGDGCGGECGACAEGESCLADQTCLALAAGCPDPSTLTLPEPACEGVDLCGWATCSCESDGDCPAGAPHCAPVDLAGGSVCLPACPEAAGVSCPAELACADLWTEEGGKASMCSPAQSAPCSACSADLDCQIYGDRCADPATTGKTYCLVGCAVADFVCPPGSTCIDGAIGPVCVPDDGVCACEVGDVGVCSKVDADDVECFGDLVCKPDVEWVCEAPVAIDGVCP